MLPRSLPLALLGALAVAAPASAGQATYKVVKATHTSSASKPSGDNDYHGTSTMTWSLAKPSSQAPNRVTISSVAGTVSGYGEVNIAGTYTIDAASRYGHCAWAAKTGDQEHPFATAMPFSLGFGPNPDTGKGIYAAFGAARASLANAYLGTECSTDVSGEPSMEETSLTPVKPKALKRRKLTLRSKGATAREGIDYRWSTTIVLKRRR